MKITNNNLHNVNIYNRERTPVTKPLNGLTSDVFQKSNVSFSGSENEMESLIDSLLDELFNPARIEKQIESYNENLKQLEARQVEFSEQKDSEDKKIAKDASKELKNIEKEINGLHSKIDKANDEKVKLDNIA